MIKGVNECFFDSLLQKSTIKKFYRSDEEKRKSKRQYFNSFLFHTISRSENTIILAIDNAVN